MPRQRQTDAFRFHRRAISVEEAVSRILVNAKPLESETVPLEQASLRRVFEHFRAPIHYPTFPRSGMDGYAVRSVDTLDASSDRIVELEVVDDIPCGSTPKAPLEPGQAARIMTGAMVPSHADSVVMLEQTESSRTNGRLMVVLKRPALPGANITPIGYEFSEGEPLLSRGTLLEEGQVAILATFGQAEVQVFRRPIVGIVPTGSELIAVRDELSPGTIRNSNSYMLAVQLRKNGAIPVPFEPVRDDLGELKERMHAAFEQCDAVITTGGVSVGDRDVLVELFEEREVQLLFNKIKIRPGSPTSAAERGGKLLLALSGNPGACFVGFELFARPALLAMQGVQESEPPIEAYLEEDFGKTNAYERFVRGKLLYRSGSVYARPAGPDRSSMVKTLADADCLIRIPPGNGIAAGELVRIVPLPRWR